MPTIYIVASDRSDLGEDVAAILVAAYEVSLRELADDVRAVQSWEWPLDELVVYLSQRHDRPADTTVSYVAALRRAMTDNLPDRGW